MNKLQVSTEKALTNLAKSLVTQLVTPSIPKGNVQSTSLPPPTIELSKKEKKKEVTRNNFSDKLASYEFKRRLQWKTTMQLFNM